MISFLFSPMKEVSDTVLYATLTDSDFVVVCYSLKT